MPFIFFIKLLTDLNWTQRSLFRNIKPTPFKCQRKIDFACSNNPGVA